MTAISSLRRLSYHGMYDASMCIPEISAMAAVSDGSGKPSGDFVDYELQRQLKGLNTATPDLSTLAQKGDEKVISEPFVINVFDNKPICLHTRTSAT